MHDVLQSVFSHAPAPERFEEALRHILRRQGYALAVPATDTSQPLVYILDRLGNGYYAGLCVDVESAWCVHRLYRQDPGRTLQDRSRTLTDAGGLIRRPS